MIYRPGAHVMLSLFSLVCVNYLRTTNETSRCLLLSVLGCNLEGSGYNFGIPTTLPLKIDRELETGLPTVGDYRRQAVP